MPRAKNFKCHVCGKESYKKDLFSVSILFSGRDNDGTKWKRNFRPKSGVCSEKCSKIWKETIYKKLEDEEKENVK